MSKRSARYTVRALMILALTAVIAAPAAPASAAAPLPVPAAVTTVDPQPLPDRLAAAARPDRATRPAWSPARPTRGLHAATVRKAATPPPSVLSFAKCVLHRESKGTLDRWQSGTGALNSSGAAGRWQFMPGWRNGLPYMIKDRLEQFGMSHKDARKVRLYLSKLHYIHKYPGVYQDIGFLEVVERGGAFHWNPTVPGTGC